ncbi:peptidoglycan DD-metalloendopeptidase family protein [Candidatus Parcubacteria bacterium]|nr:peptidoglycan DD-metalloendopeptidase family protein [Candidatus Parcubacteria bacterium]
MIKKLIFLLPIALPAAFVTVLFGLMFMAAAMIVPATSSEATAAPVALAPSGQATADIPPEILTIYQQAAERCPGLSWTYVAAIIKKESNHGRFGGGTTAPNGEVTPWIIGIRLDGGGSGRTKVARILDTDNGRWDRDTVFDRAVGPAQFIPSTWQTYAQDGNGDGLASPHNYYDATAATARYLCALGAPDNMRQALFGYNAAWWYVNEVEATAESYGQVAVPPPAQPLNQHLSGYGLPVDRALVSPGILTRPHHDGKPAIDISLTTGTPVYSVTSGEVLAVVADDRCGNGVTVLGTDGFKYTYCHASSTQVAKGQLVATGEPIMLSGNSGRSSGPHLHFQISTALGIKICPQPLLVAWYEGRPLQPQSQPTATRCS